MIKFVYWEGWPALLGETEARALLHKGDTDWTYVDYMDVCLTAGICDEKTWRRMFSDWGPAMDNLPTLDQTAPTPANKRSRGYGQ